MLQDKIKMVSEIKGMSTKTSELFVTNIKPFVCFIKEANLLHKIKEKQEENKKSINCDHPICGKKIVMSGFREKELMQLIKNVGGINENQLSKDTFALIMKNVNEESGKKTTALKENIPIFDVNGFVNKYFQCLV